MSRSGVSVCAGSVAGMLALVMTCAAQPIRPDRLQRVEQGIADVDGLRRSLRETQTDLRTPSGFESVYVLERIDAFGRSDRSFMRIDGATYAVFPRSVYRSTPRGRIADIPAGTVFHIGGLPKSMAPSAKRPAPRSPTFVSTAIDSRVDAPPPAPQEPVLAPEASRRSPVAREISTFDDETFRQHRVGDLLNRALAEELRRRGAAPAAYPAR